VSNCGWICSGKNRRVDPIESGLQEIHIIGIYEGRGSNDRFVQAVHIICVIEAEGGLHDRQLHDKLDARRAAESKISVRRDGELLLHVAPGKLLGEILEALKIEVESAGASNSIGSAVEEKGGGLPDLR